MHLLAYLIYYLFFAQNAASIKTGDFSGLIHCHILHLQVYLAHFMCSVNMCSVNDYNLEMLYIVCEQRKGTLKMKW